MPQTTTRPTVPARRLWSRNEYYRMAEIGLFRDQRVELIEGEIIQMPPMQEPHATGIEKTRLALEAAFGPKCWARAQMPLHLRRRSAPEPDVAVVLGRPGDFQTAPTAADALLVCEVSDATLALDRGRKASLYASAGLAAYWIVNIRDGHLEIRRTPVPDPGQRHKYRYADVQILQPADRATPLAAPKARIPVADLLP